MPSFSFPDLAADIRAVIQRADAVLRPYGTATDPRPFAAEHVANARIACATGQAVLRALDAQPATALATDPALREQVDDALLDMVLALGAGVRRAAPGDAQWTEPGAGFMAWREALRVLTSVKALHAPESPKALRPRAAAHR